MVPTETAEDRLKQERAEALSEGLGRLYGLVERLDQSAQDARYIRNILAKLTIHTGGEIAPVETACAKFGCVYAEAHYHPGPSERMYRVGEGHGEYQTISFYDVWYEVHDIFLCGAALYCLIRGRSVRVTFGEEETVFLPADPATQFYVPLSLRKSQFRKFTLQFPMPEEPGT